MWMNERSVRDLFLDTSAQFNRHSLDAESKREIAELLGTARITGTSTYARLEFKMSFLQDLAYLHGKLRQFQAFDRVFAHLARLPEPYSRKLRRALTHLARFWQNISGGDAERIDAILHSIEQQALSLWRWFDASVDYIADGTGCVRSAEPPRLVRGYLEVTMKNCRPERIRCRIHKFFGENRVRFDAIVREISLLPAGDKSNELNRLEQITTRAVNDPTMLCDDRVCRKIGDALIGMDGMAFPAIVSSNSREFKTICKALGKELIQIRPS